MRIVNNLYMHRTFLTLIYIYMDNPKRQDINTNLAEGTMYPVALTMGATPRGLPAGAGKTSWTIVCSAAL